MKKGIKRAVLRLLLFVGIFLFVYNFEGIVSNILIMLNKKPLNIEVIETIDIKKEDDNKMISKDNNLIIYSNEEIQIYDEFIELISKKSINTLFVKLVKMDDYFLAADITQGDLIVLDYSGNVISEIKKTKMIKEIRTANNDIIVITNENKLIVYNELLEEKSQLTLPKGEILSVELTDDKSKCVITILSVEDSEYNSKIITFDIKKNTMIGGYNNYQKIVYESKLNDDNIIVVEDDGIKAHKLGDIDENVWEYKREGNLIYFDIDNNNSIYELVTTEIIQIKDYYLVCLNKDGKKKFNLELKDKYDKIIFSKGRVLIYNENKIKILTSDGEELIEIDKNNKIKDIIWIDDLTISIMYEDEVQICKLNY